MKKYSKCKLYKNLDEFYKSGKDGFQSYCKVCAKQAVKESQANDELYYDKTKRYNKDKLDRAKLQIKSFKREI